MACSDDMHKVAPPHPTYTPHTPPTFFARFACLRDMPLCMGKRRSQIFFGGGKGAFGPFPKYCHFVSATC